VNVAHKRFLQSKVVSENVMVPTRLPPRLQWNELRRFMAHGKFSREKIAKNKSAFGRIDQKINMFS
jgi:hypothetical protein